MPVVSVPVCGQIFRKSKVRTFDLPLENCLEAEAAFSGRKRSQLQLCVFSEKSKFFAFGLSEKLNLTNSSRRAGVLYAGGFCAGQWPSFSEKSKVRTFDLSLKKLPRS